MNDKQSKLFSLSDKFSSIFFMNLKTMCSVYKIVINVEIILAIIGALLGFKDSHGLSIGYFGLLFFLLFIPQYIFAEIGILLDKLAKNQKQEED